MRKKLVLAAAAVFVLSSAFAQKAKDTGGDVKANESTAVGCLRSLNTAQVFYARTYKDIGFTCRLADFSPPAAGQQASAKASDLIDPSLTSGTKAGYRFTLTCPQKSKPQTSYQISAVPISPGKSGKRAFCTDQTAIIKSSDDGKAQTCFTAGKPL